MSKDKDSSRSTDDAGALDADLTDLEIAEASVTLATLDEEGPLAPHVREQVEARANALLGKRAKLHARKRAEAYEREIPKRAIPPLSAGMQSTTSAGSQVVGAFEEERPARGPALLAWGGWAFAAAAIITLFIGRSADPPRATAGGPPAPHVVERIELRGSGEVVGELRYDRSDGTVVVTLARAPKLNPEQESLELWISFEGDSAPRPITLLDKSSAETSFGAGRPLCQGALSRDAPRCTPIRDVVVTREERHGTLTFMDERAVLRADRRP